MGVNGEVERVEGGPPGLEVILKGGFPQGRLTLATGTAGSGKTIFGAQFLATGIEQGEPGVFVTFEERPDRISSDIAGFGWDVPAWESQGKWTFVDASPNHVDDVDVLGAFDLSPLIARVRHAVESSNARRVTIDSIGALITRFDNPGPARRALFEVGAALETLGVTTVMTGERPDDYGPVGQFGFEEFLADCVILLRNALTSEKRRRTIEVLKVRGGSHMRGEHLFTIRPGTGLVVVPNATLDFDYRSSTERTTSGNAGLDQMLRGGLLERSLVLVNGPTGTGKSLLTAQFIAGGALNGERSLLHSFEEGRSQLIRNAAAWGFDFEKMESDGVLKIVSEAPESKSLEDHLLSVKTVIEEFKPERVAIDSLTALQRVATTSSFREYVLGLAFRIKKSAMVGLVTTTGTLNTVDMNVNDLHVSTITDTIITLHYVGMDAEMRRGINVLKMRGSDHDKAIHEFTIDDHGLHIHAPFSGMLGHLVPLSASASGHVSS